MSDTPPGPVTCKGAWPLVCPYVIVPPCEIGEGGRGVIGKIDCERNVRERRRGKVRREERSRGGGGKWVGVGKDVEETRGTREGRGEKRREGRERRYGNERVTEN